MSWWSHLTHGVGDWLGKEWHNTEKWLPEIGLGAAAAASAIFAPYLLPEELGAMGSIGGAAEGIGSAIGSGASAIGEGLGAIGEGIGSAASSVGDAIGFGGGEAGMAGDLGTSQAMGLGASNVDTAIGSVGPTSIGTAGGDVGLGSWDATVAAGDVPTSELPITGAGATTQGPGEILGGGDVGDHLPFTTSINPADPGAVTGSVSGGGAVDPGQQVIQDTFGKDFAPGPANVNPGEGLGAQMGSETAGGGGVMSKLFGADSMLGGISNTDLLKYGIPAAYLGYSMLGRRSEMPPQANQAQRIAQQEAQVGSTELAAAAAGQLTSPMQSSIDIYVQNATNQLRQQYASAGRDWQHDTGYLQGVQQIAQQADAMREKYIELEFNEGLKASGQATSTMMQVAQLQFQEDKQFQDAIGNAMRMLGMAAVGGSGGINLKLA